MNTAAIESLRTFATAHGELAFAHMCTAALEGEEWAVERIIVTAQLIEDMQIANELTGGGTAYALDAIRATDTTRPDGMIARTLTI